MLIIRAIGKVIYWTIEALAIIVVGFFYLLSRPFVYPHNFAFNRRGSYRAWLLKNQIRHLAIGKEINSWSAYDVRKDYLIADLSRLNEELVGVRTREYGVLHRTKPPPEFSDEIEYISVWSLP